MDLVIGAPVLRREWILPRWFQHTEAACEKANLAPHYLFVCDERDEGTKKIIVDTTRALNRGCHIIHVVEQRGIPEVFVRIWDHPRYEWMVYLRNELLKGVRALDPELFLSLDTDILLHSDALVSMLDAMRTEEFDGVGGKAFLTPLGSGCWAPTWANLTIEERLERDNRDIVMQVDVIMAIKLMNRKLYNQDYQFHHQGEDIGFCKAAKKNGCYLGWDGRVTNRHVMTPEELSQVDQRCGF
jgi:hypothetical protein